MYDDLIEFLLARLDEDDRQAGDVHARGCAAASGGECDCGRPERMRADVEAKRRIVTLYAQTGHVPDTAGEPSYDGGVQSALSDVALLLAQPYADHADYQPAWEV